MELEEYPKELELLVEWPNELLSEEGDDSLYTKDDEDDEDELSKDEVDSDIVDSDLLDSDIDSGAT